MNNIQRVVEEGMKFYKELEKDNNGRYKSWEYCYKVFNDAHNFENLDEEYKVKC